MSEFIADKLLFKSQPIEIGKFLGDMRNFRSIMPEQVEDWYADENECKFFIKNLGKLGMKNEGGSSSSPFKFASIDTSKVKFTLIFHYNSAGNDVSEGYFEILAEMNSLVEMMARRPLTNFVNILTKNLQKKMA